MTTQDKTLEWLKENQVAIQSVFDMFRSHELRTGHLPTTLWVSGTEEFVCECGIWNIKAALADGPAKERP